MVAVAGRLMPSYRCLLRLAESRRVEGFHLALNGLMQFHSRFREIVLLLKIHPELRAVAEEARQAERGVGSDGAPAMNDVSNPRRRNSNPHRQSVLTDAERDKEFFAQHFARMRGDPLDVPAGSWSRDDCGHNVCP